MQDECIPWHYRYDMRCNIQIHEYLGQGCSESGVDNRHTPHRVRWWTPELSGAACVRRRPLTIVAMPFIRDFVRNAG